MTFSFYREEEDLDLKLVSIKDYLKVQNGEMRNQKHIMKILLVQKY